jgi:hypothetical protein
MSQGRKQFAWQPPATDDAPCLAEAEDSPRRLCLPVEVHEDMDFDPADNAPSELPDPAPSPPAAPSHQLRIPRDAKVTLRLPLALAQTNPQTQLFGSVVDGGDAPVLSAASRPPMAAPPSGPPGSKYAPARRYFRGTSVTVAPTAG